MNAFKNFKHLMTNIISFIICLFFATLTQTLSAQELYVDPINGQDTQTGSAEEPLASLAAAVYRANNYTGTGSIRIRLFPGLYTLDNKIPINPLRVMSDTAVYSIEAVTMPDDQEWSPDKMPIIQSVSPNNSETQFPHATGLLVSTAHVKIQGLKFLGNSNPGVSYYYPISKENPALEDLEVSQCYFVGNKESAPIQGGVWAHGPKNSVTHCIFYECRNAVLFFQNVRDFTIANSIIFGAYESAFWFGPEDVPFTFTNNVIADCHYFLVGPQDLKYSSAFTHSVIANNAHEVGYWSGEQQKVVAMKSPSIEEKDIVKRGKISLVRNESVQLPENHLHLAPGSTGLDLQTGVFKKPH